MDGIKACCFGRLGGEPELRYLPNGTPMLKCSVAVEDNKAPENSPTEWVRVTLFGERAEELLPPGGSPRLQKGDQVYAEGRVRLNTWQSNGEQRSGLELTAWIVQPIGAFRRPVESGQSRRRAAA